jgi:Zn-finger nucleic acid-binding protein
MECPKCQARMEVVVFEDMEVDRCVRCGGPWFDARGTFFDAGEFTDFMDPTLGKLFRDRRHFRSP